MSVSVVNAIKCGVEKINLCIKSAAQTIVDAINQSVQPDYEINDSGWICSDVTDTWVRILTPYVDGVEGTPQTVDSGIACDEPAPSNPVVDTELVCNTATGFYDLVTVITTDGVASAPTFAATTVACTRDTLQLTPLEPMCASVDGGEPVEIIPVVVFNQNTNTVSGTRYFDREANEVTGTVEKLKDCACGCETCDACIEFQAFDNAAPSFWTVGDTSNWDVNGVTVVQDALSTFDGTNVSTGYQQIIDEVVNNVANFALSVVTDVTSGKPTWRVEYTGSGSETLTITNGASGDIYTFTVDSSGNMTATAQSSGGDDLTDDDFMGGSAITITNC